MNILGFQQKLLQSDANAPKLSPQELVQLIDKTDVLGKHLPPMLLRCQDLLELVKQADEYGELRTEVPINEAVRQGVLREVQKHAPDFANEYAAMTVLSNKIAQAQRLYRTDPAQVYMATWCMN